MTAATRVCCSMISDIHTRYGSRSLRHGRSRRLPSYHVSSRSEKCLRLVLLLRLLSCFTSEIVRPMLLTASVQVFRGALVATASRYNPVPELRHQTMQTKRYM